MGGAAAAAAHSTRPQLKGGVLAPHGSTARVPPRREGAPAAGAGRVRCGELLRLTEQNVRTPCHGADEWTSDHAEDRAYAAALCHPCAVLALCRKAADELKATYHVWGGRDRTTPTRPKPTQQPTRPDCEAVA